MGNIQTISQLIAAAKSVNRSTRQQRVLLNMLKLETEYNLALLDHIRKQNSKHTRRRMRNQLSLNGIKTQEEKRYAKHLLTDLVRTDTLVTILSAVDEGSGIRRQLDRAALIRQVNQDLPKRMTFEGLATKILHKHQILKALLSAIEMGHKLPNLFLTKHRIGDRVNNLQLDLRILQGLIARARNDRWYRFSYLRALLIKGLRNLKRGCKRLWANIGLGQFQGLGDKAAGNKLAIENNRPATRKAARKTVVPKSTIRTGRKSQ